MSEAFATINGKPLAGFWLCVPEVGPWFIDTDQENAEALPVGLPVTVTINGASLTGTVLPQFEGTHGLQRKTRIVGGAGAWGSLIARKGYHNDAGVKASLVANDAAREAGETIGGFEPFAERIGVNFVRKAGLASAVLEKAIGDALWWVDYAGLTQVALERPTADAKSDAYEVLEFNARTGDIELGVEGLTVGVGSVIKDRLDKPATIRSFELTMTGTALKMKASTAEFDRSIAGLTELMRSIVERFTDGKLYGSFRYRVVSMGVDGRVNLQNVRQASEAPDLLLVDQWPGVAGTHAELTKGAEVLVEFVEGRETEPVVTHFAGKTGRGYIPVKLLLGGGGLRAARMGDLVTCGGTGTVATFSPVPPAAGGPLATGVPYLISFGPLAQPQTPLYGAVSSGSELVEMSSK